MFRYVIAAVAAILLLGNPAPARSVELVFWTTEFYEERLVVIDFLCKAFGVMQDDVTVKVVSVDENELFGRMRQAVAAGDAPHLVGAGSDFLVALSGTGYLDMEAASRIVRRIGVDRFYSGALSMLAEPGGGRWYGVPFHGWVQGIWYRADWFEEAGLAPPETWVDILAAARRFTDPAKGRYGIVFGTGYDYFTTQVFTQMAASNGAAMFGEDGRVVFDNPAMVETLKFYAELARYSPPGSQTWRARDYFLQGKLAMLFYSTFIMDDLALERVAADSLTGGNFADLDGADFDPNLVRNVRMVPFIRRDSRAGYGLISGFGVRGGLEPQERKAVDAFLDFLYEPARYVTWLHMAPGGMLPVLRDVAESDLFLADPSGIFRRYGRHKIRKIIDGLNAIRTFGIVNGKRQPAASLVYARDIIPRMIDRTLFKGVSASESVRATAEEIRAMAGAMHAE